jgi:hypothetical protein
VPAKEMTEEESKRGILPRANANCFSFLTFWWTLPMFKRAQEKEIIELEDLYLPLPEDEACGLGDRLEK